MTLAGGMRFLAHPLQRGMPIATQKEARNFNRRTS